MRCSAAPLALAVLVGCGGAADRICSPVPSFASPASQCVAVAARPPEPKRPDPEPKPTKPPPEPEPTPPEPEPEPTAPEPEPTPPEPEPEPTPPEPTPPAPEPDRPSAVVVGEKMIELDRTIQFKGTSARLLDDSKDLLDEVARVLDEHRELKMVRIEGHTDSTGRDSKNLKLSKKRASAVRSYLIKRGIAKGRLKATGFGGEEPVADNATEEGRLKNRRVDFRILKRDDPNGS